MSDNGKIEREILRLVNGARHKTGSLDHCDRLAGIARSHSRQMANAGNIWHGNGVHQAGGFAGENVAMVPAGGSSTTIAKRFHKCWINSPGHRANIMNGGFGLLGVGIAQRGKYYYGTQLFKGSDFGFGGGFQISKKTQKKIEDFFLWLITFLAGIWLFNLASPFVGIAGMLSTALFFGFSVETVSKLFQVVRYKKQFKVGRSYLLWIFIHTLLYYVLTQFMGTKNLWFAPVYTVIVYAVWKLDGKKFRLVKDFIVWWITFTIGVLVANSFAFFIKAPNPFVTALFIGFFIETTSKLIQVLRSKIKFVVDKWYVFWILIMGTLYSAAVYVMQTISFKGDFWTSISAGVRSAMNISYDFWILCLLSLLITLATFGIWRIRFYKKYLWLSSFVLLIILYFITMGLPVAVMSLFGG